MDCWFGLSILIYWSGIRKLEERMKNVVWGEKSKKKKKDVAEEKMNP